MNDSLMSTSGSIDVQTDFCVAFRGQECVASGSLEQVASTVARTLSPEERMEVLIFDGTTSEQVGVDFRGSPEEVIARLPRRSSAEPMQEGLATPSRRGPGRPKLGVVGREVTLLPRHWEWLDGQPGGASVALRRLVEEARRSRQGQDQTRRAQEAAYKFMLAVAGDLPGYQEALRALYAKDREGFARVVNSWPADVRRHVERLALATGI